MHNSASNFDEYMERHEVCISMEELEKSVKSSVVSVLNRLQQEVSDEVGNNSRMLSKKKGNNSHNIKMKRIVADLLHTSAAADGWIVHKVPYMLRQVNEKAYEPRLVSIGPYHHGKEHLRPREVIKRSFFERLLNETNVKPKVFVDAIMKEEETFRGRYEAPFDHIDSYTFVKMLVLDGCFILQLFKEAKEANKCYEIEGDIQNAIPDDLLLLENQLPFDVLLTLYGIIKRDKCLTKNRKEKKGDVCRQEIKEELYDSALRFFKYSVLGEKITARAGDIKGYDADHLLGLVYYSWLSSCETKIKQNRSDASKEDEGSTKLHNELEAANTRPLNKTVAAAKEEAEGAEEETKMLNETLREKENNQGWSKGSRRRGRRRYKEEKEAASEEKEEEEAKAADKDVEEDTKKHNEMPNEEENSQGWMASLCKTFWPFQNRKSNSTTEDDDSFISSATDLEKAGINFKRNKNASLLDIEFAAGKKELKIPRLVVDDGTERTLRNMMAYEQFIINSDCRTWVCDYVTFMDNLMDSGKDVQLLRNAKVIQNWLGDDEVVATMFNKLGDFITVAGDKYYYKDKTKKVKKHCSKKWHKWMATLKRDYFNSPWSYVSFFAALLLIALTIAQTIFSVLSYVKQ